MTTKQHLIRGLSVALLFASQAGCGSSQSGPGTGANLLAQDDAGDDAGNRAAACALGFDRDAADGGRVCNATTAGQCFETNEEACACAGCASGTCMIAESYPTQVSCNGGEPDPCAVGFAQDAADETRVCNSTANGLCFESDDEACACAGCADSCVILESFPTQARCDQT
jgi:hypothetical protein